MKINTECNFSSLLFVNPYKDRYKALHSNLLAEIKSPIFTKEQFVISYLNTKDFIFAQTQLSRNIPNEDIEDALINKLYDELGLDQAVEYKMQCIEIFHILDNEVRNFNVFLVNPSTIKKIYSKTVAKIKYIDTIIPAPLLFKSLYSTNIIKSTGTHTFIYIQENDTSISIYNDHEFIYTKSINYSLIDLHENFCTLFNEQIQYDEFINFISTKNLKYTNSEYKKDLILLYQDFFAKINEVLNYAKKAFELTKIDKIYIDFQMPTLTKLDEMIEVELNIRATHFDFDFNLESSTNFVDPLDALMNIHTTLDDDKRYDSNFTIYKRPPKFIKRESGKILMLTLASFIIAFAYPVAYWALSYFQVFHLESLNEKFLTVHKEKMMREITIKRRQKDSKKALELLKFETKEYSNKKNTLIKIHEIQVNYPMKAKIIAKLTQNLNNYNVNIDKLIYIETNNLKQISLHIIASDDKKITQLVKYLTKTYANIFKLSLKNITYDTINKRYISQLEVTIL